MPRCAFLACLGGLAMAACQWLVYSYAPLEKTMGLVQKILYLHLPMAWWGMFSFLIVCVASIAYLKKRTPFWDAVAKSAAVIGVVLTGLALLSGSIWARHSWGVWWTDDPRLTTSLVMFFAYSGYLALRQLAMSAERKSLICAVFGIVAFADIPLVFLSARLWRSIHPAVFAAKGGGLDADMRIALFGCVLAFGFLWAAFLGILTRQELQLERLELLEAHTA